MEKVRCAYCGEEMDCPENMKHADVHICQFCTQVMEPGMSEKEIAEMSRLERKLYPYYSDVNEMTETVFALTWNRFTAPRDELKEMSKREIEEESFWCGIFAAFEFILYTAG
ncbi:MAG TPA: hypothetical protein ENG00_01125, partial [Candidatus Aenigmarchaeota archaeon]|nr:hypothetical protein [Candidatus Aenigmarchaeota archaeon]